MPRWKTAIAVVALAAAPLGAAAQIVSASKLIGAAVVSEEEQLGHITDLAIDIRSAQVRYAILYAGPRSNLGEQVFAVALQDLRPGLRQDYLALQPAAAPPAPPQGTERMARASELIGRNVANVRGEDVGAIQDLGVDLESSRVAFAVLELQARGRPSGVLAQDEGPLKRLPLAAFDFPPLGGDAVLR
jgi:sporulation protein YlmC with PRC-barrel domain